MRTTPTKVSHHQKERLPRGHKERGQPCELRLASPLILVQLDPVYVTFNPSETDLIEIQRARAAARATISNADLSLLPGQFVRIRLAIRMEPDALMVPQTALGSSQLGKYVYVVGEGNKADQRLVSLGPTDGSLVAVLKGVSEGERVIIGNLQKIGPGAAIQPLLQ
jgi:multidrug efflux system membrane fusion protein